MNLVNFLILIKKLLNSEPTFLAFRHGIKVVPHILNLVIFVAVVNSSKTDQKYRTKYCIRQKSSDPLKISKSQMHKFWFPVIFQREKKFLLIFPSTYHNAPRPIFTLKSKHAKPLLQIESCQMFKESRLLSNSSLGPFSENPFLQKIKFEFLSIFQIYLNSTF